MVCFFEEASAFCVPKPSRWRRIAIACKHFAMKIAILCRILYNREWL